jgi:hypothetical protein
MSNIIDWHDNLADVPAFYTGTGSSNLVPSVFPVAIDGRPYMIDQKSGDFTRGFEARIRDTFDQATEPGESTINPQGLWRRSQNSWHVGAGQVYGDVDSTPFRFFKSKGINPWNKGQLTLHNSTTLLSLTATADNAQVIVAGDRLYAINAGVVSYTLDPFVASPTWVTTTHESTTPTGSIQATTTDGFRVYVAYPNDGVRSTNTSGSVISNTKVAGTTTGNYTMLGFAKNYVFGGVSNVLNNISGATEVAFITHRDTNFRWVDIATGQNAIYAAGWSGNNSQVFKITISDDSASLRNGGVALELPTGEIITAIKGYLGFVLIGTNKGVRFCSTDNQSNLISGPLIATPNAVYDFTTEGRFAWFTYTNYDGVSTGLGRLDLSVFSSPNTPAWATDLMYTSTAAVKSCDTILSKRVFVVTGAGIVVENTASPVATGQIETGKFRWGIMDRKFVVKLDLRTLNLKGSVAVATALDNEDYVTNGTSTVSTETQHTFNGTEKKMIEAGFKITLTKGSLASDIPVLTRFTARAYVTPTRSQFFKVPVLLHRTLNMWGRPYTVDVESELSELRQLVLDPHIVLYQEGNEIFSVVVEDVEWKPIDAHDRKWEWDGTAIVTMRSMQE